LKQKRNAEFALIRRHADEPCFGVQLAALKPEEAAWAAALVAARGADFIDLNIGCPIDYFTRKGLGASIGRHPNRLRRLVEAVVRAAAPLPVTAKIRLGWSDEDRNYLDQARAAIDGGAVALTVHGRTRNARYRLAADWRAIGEIVAAVAVPVIGNGDLLFPHEIERARRESGCAAVMIARGVLIKPWIFREAASGYWDITADDRLSLYRRYGALAREHWGTDDYGLERVRTFIAWHLDFWSRYVPRLPDGAWPSMQQRAGAWEPRSALEALLARGDEGTIAYLADCLTRDLPIDPLAAPAGDTPTATARTLEVQG
jgi:tRNA-dihydrouridine synthase 3